MTSLKQVSALFITLSLLLPFSAACTPTLPSSTQSALPPPEQWVWELESKYAPASELRTLRILGSRKWERGALVFLSYRDEMGTETFGYSLLEPNSQGNDWTTAGGHLHGRTTPVPDTEFIDWSLGSGGGMTIASGAPSEVHLDPVVFYGRALDDQVKAVEVTLAGGQPLRDETSDHMFGIVVQPTANACELLVLGDADRVLRTIELPVTMPGGAGIAIPAECPPD